MLGRVNCSGSNFQTILGAWPMKSSWHCQIDTFKSAIWQGQILKTSNIAALSEQGKKLGRVNCSGSNFQTRLGAMPMKSSWWPTLHNWKRWQCSSFNCAREKNSGRAKIVPCRMTTKLAVLIHISRKRNRDECVLKCSLLPCLPPRDHGLVIPRQRRWCSWSPPFNFCRYPPCWNLC